MSYSALASRLPGFLRRQVLHFESAIEDAVAGFAAGIPDGRRVLDAGAGEGQYAHFFERHRYCAVDLAVGDAQWNYRELDAIADLTALPFGAECFAACLNVVTLEHLREPACALREMARTLTPRGELLLVAPHEWEVHQAPHDYFRYTRHGLEYLLQSAGMVDIRIQPVGGYFRLLSRRLMNGLQFFTNGWRWILFPLVVILVALPALVLPWFDGLDRECNFTLGYICTARKS